MIHSSLRARREALLFSLTCPCKPFIFPCKPLMNTPHPMRRLLTGWHETCAARHESAMDLGMVRKALPAENEQHR